jgi:uncharacterized protein YjdB
MTIEPAEVTIAVGDTATITAVLTPADAQVQNITWRYVTTNRNSKLTTDGTTAKFTSKKVGTYTVTVNIDDFTAECTVHVEEATGVDNTTTVTIEPRKEIVNGRVLIRTQDGTYTLMGQEL